MRRAGGRDHSRNELAGAAAVRAMLFVGASSRAFNMLCDGPVHVRIGGVLGIPASEATHGRAHRSTLAVGPPLEL